MSTVIEISCIETTVDGLLGRPARIEVLGALGNLLGPARIRLLGALVHLLGPACIIVLDHLLSEKGLGLAAEAFFYVIKSLTMCCKRRLP